MQFAKPKAKNSLFGSMEMLVIQWVFVLINEYINNGVIEEHFP